MTDTQYLYQYFLEQSQQDKKRSIKPNRTVKKATVLKTVDKTSKSGDMPND